MNNNKSIFILFIFVALSISCVNTPSKELDNKNYSHNILDYTGTPKNAYDKNMLMFSDQGAWYAYSLPDTTGICAGFSGPFLMTQQNGVWSSPSLSTLQLFDSNNSKVIWDNYQANSYNSHLSQSFGNDNLSLKQELLFVSGHTAIIRSVITNASSRNLEITVQWKNKRILAEGLKFTSNGNELTINSTHTNAIGHIVFSELTSIISTDSSYLTVLKKINLEPNNSKEIIISQSFVFPKYSWEKERKLISNIDYDSALAARVIEKEGQLSSLIENRKSQFQEDKYAEVLTKAHLTLQNNWRVPAGEIKYEGLFPSYHYKWFNGFWSWDSWKHAVGLSYYNSDLAKKQMKLMFAFQKEDGFIVDCVYRDTTIEAHNYRDTKPPLSAWAVANIYDKDNDLEFIKYIYPKLKNYHYWWYSKRDHDQDGLCEYGSTDGSLVAAKWESGMDNAIRFDNSIILKNKEGAYSLDQESVDLNAYLYAEKLYLATLATALGKTEDVAIYNSEAESLKMLIQQQFYDTTDGWFYDTNLAGDQFIKGEGSEGWTALWANAATPSQAEAVKTSMMNPDKFYTKIPFQTMSADHPKFDPLKGYWRGPNWLDQAYFGVKGLRNYGFNEEADRATIQILEGAEGLLGKGKSIRENYHPLTGEGLHAQNFSWSAAHIIMLLMED